MDNTQDAKTHNKELVIGTVVVGVIIALIAVIGLVIYNSTPKIVYQPAAACAMLDAAEAKELLGNSAIRSNVENPQVSGNTATSKCGYTDGNPDTNQMMVAAVIVRSGINDKGTQQNKTEFATSKPSKNAETVKDVGESAYFNRENGQLNILDGRRWIILSYGVGSAPQANTVEKAVELAKVVLR